MNWFRRGDDGRFLWPGFGENSRVLKWVVERLEGCGGAVETPIGHVPTPESLDVAGLDLTAEDLAAVLRVDPDEWRAEIPAVTEWFAKFGDKLPGVLWSELDALKARLGHGRLGNAPTRSATRSGPTVSKVTDSCNATAHRAGR